MPTRIREMTIPHLGFVGGLLYAVRKAGRPREPPEYRRAARITQELFRDPVIMSQTGTRTTATPSSGGSGRRAPHGPELERGAVHDAVRPELGDTRRRERVVRGERRQGAGDARARHARAAAGAPTASGPETHQAASRRGFGRGGTLNGTLDGTLAGVGSARRTLVTLASTGLFVVSVYAQRAVRRLGIRPSVAAHVAALASLAFACAFVSGCLIVVETIIQGLARPPRR